ncbi:MULTISPECIES: TIGR01212 family radical SAM protein [Lachnospiraceae]|jgi:radical SAM protein (TIGR01212 family)|uniref:TIGR01212 family radical SAM protein n=1 Tax=Faecalicatena acetigenes TaxID=2981790 RepID=A0ABT2TE72_9FIRM|nr:MULTISPECIES: TIGR01212 family radical SAM protein [Lachnospiraceae]MCU6748296.1 TIGR01212 family radical SAM protein [Faecalicatena acetigenes]RGT71472.1 TIGR01212 family radical SAM protein [Ruminococcus sp. AF18-22]SCI36400.1 radical SAM protein [uncultured Clostridium sp.]
MKQWGEKRYYSLDYYLKQTYGEKIYKISLNAGLTCPNRDGTVGTGGCIFCSDQGSGDFAGCPTESVTEQLQKGKAVLRDKRPVHSYIAYFQAFTNTYAPLDRLESLYMEAVQDPDVKILSIATRPDCLSKDILSLLSRINKIKPVWIELGLQTIHPASAAYIRRGYPLSVFDKAVADLRENHIPVIVHTILFLPGETKEQMLQTISYLNRMDIQGIKLQLLHVLQGTDLASVYRTSPFHIPSMEEYIEMLGECIGHLNPDFVIHRLTGDGPKDLLIAPLWTSRKRTVLNALEHCLKENDIWQGKEYHG